VHFSVWLSITLGQSLTCAVNAAEGGDVGEELYGKNPAPNMLRALSLVPSEARRLICAIDDEYVVLESAMDMTHSSQRALTRPQVELVAARETLSAALGSVAVVYSSITAGVFGLLDRAANGVRITAEPKVLQPRSDFRVDFGINYYRSAANTLACSSLSQYWCR